MTRFVAIRRPALLRLPLVALGFLVASSAQAQFFAAHNLVSDDPALFPAALADGHLLNGWGLASSATSPFWVSSNGAGRAVVYNVNPATDATSKVNLEVTIPGDGTVTGQVFSNVAGNFNGDTFLFVSEDGTVSGWRGALGTSAETLQTALPNNSYTGATVFNNAGDVYLYAANFAAGTVDVLLGNPGAPNLAGSFTDPNLPSGYAPFNVQHLADKIFVTYALRDTTTGEDVAGPGHGFVSAFDTNGNFLARIATQGALNSPWGLALAPSSFGALAGDLLVGNFGDGMIQAFDLDTLANDGPLMVAGNVPLTIEGLWGLMVGNNGSAGSASRVYFSAGPAGETHGLFGVIQLVPEPSTWWLFAAGLAVVGVDRRRLIRI